MWGFVNTTILVIRLYPKIQLSHVGIAAPQKSFEPKEKSMGREPTLSLSLSLNRSTKVGRSSQIFKTDSDSTNHSYVILNRIARQMHVPNCMHLSAKVSEIWSLKYQHIQAAFYAHFTKLIPFFSACKLSFIYTYNFCYSVFTLHRIDMLFFLYCSSRKYCKYSVPNMQKCFIFALFNPLS